MVDTIDFRLLEERRIVASQAAPPRAGNTEEQPHAVRLSLAGTPAEHSEKGRFVRTIA